MKANRPILLLVTVLLSSSLLSAQTDKLEAASKAYENYDYIKAQKRYLEVAQTGYVSENLCEKLGNAYYFNAQYKNALKWYKKLFRLNPTPTSVYYLRYSQCLRANGKTANAMTYYDLYWEKIEAEQPVEKLTANQYLGLIQLNSGRYSIKALTKINTPGIEFGGRRYGNQFIYASTHNKSLFYSLTSSWDGMNFLNLYKVKIEGNTVLSKAKKIRGKVDGNYHESIPVFSSDGKTMYFTRSNYTEKKENKKLQLKIYRTHLVDGKWTTPEDLSINSDLYSTAHPALSPDGRMLYFSSNRPGGYGQSDLYVVSIRSNGTLGKAVNLGAKINTQAKEIFPFVSRNKVLYFSSDGHFGTGGLDVFYVKLKKNHPVGSLLNIGQPINSFADDFAFTFDPLTKQGFFSSNRGDSLYTFIHSDIYWFKENKPIVNGYEAQITGVVTDMKTGQPIEDAKVLLYTRDKRLLEEKRTNANGIYNFEMNYFNAYKILSRQENYDALTKRSKPELRLQNIDFQLQRNTPRYASGTNLVEVLNSPILFDYDKTRVRPAAQKKLDKLVLLLKKNPLLKIEIRAHTDSRGGAAYNQALSERRAKSIQKYLVVHGIDKSRLSAKGYGETQLLNECRNGVSCSEAAHQLNRRSEFIVMD